MNTVRIILISMMAMMSLSAGAAENCTALNKKSVCTEDAVKAKVDEACGILEAKGKDGVADVKKMRFDCCGEPNYVWINDMTPKMIMHPIKPQLDGTDISNNADPDGVKLFVEFVKAVKKTPKGSWVDYRWTKLGEADATPKKSWVKSCKAKGEAEAWVVGSGTWK